MNTPQPIGLADAVSMMALAALVERHGVPASTADEESLARRAWRLASAWTRIRVSEHAPAFPHLAAADAKGTFSLITDDGVRDELPTRDALIAFVRLVSHMRAAQKDAAAAGMSLTVRDLDCIERTVDAVDESLAVLLPLVERSTGPKGGAA